MSIVIIGAGPNLGMAVGLVSREARGAGGELRGDGLSADSRSTLPRPASWRG
jgi:hypothetical protein